MSKVGPINNFLCTTTVFCMNFFCWKITQFPTEFNAHSKLACAVKYTTEWHPIQCTIMKNSLEEISLTVPGY